MTVPVPRRRGLPMAEASAMANPLSVPVAVVGTAVYALATLALQTQAGRLGHVDRPACAALLGGSLPTIALTRLIAARVADRVHSVAHVVLLVTPLLVMPATGARRLLSPANPNTTRLRRLRPRHMRMGGADTCRRRSMSRPGPPPPHPPNPPPPNLQKDHYCRRMRVMDGRWHGCVRPVAARGPDEADAQHRKRPRGKAEVTGWA